MNIWFFLFLLFFTLFSILSVAGSLSHTSPKRQIFKPKSITSYNEYLKNHTYSLVLFSMPNCALSKYARKTIKIAFKAFKTKPKEPFFDNLGLSIVNLKRVPSLAKTLNISSTPQLMIFRETFPFKNFLGSYYENSDKILNWFLQEITRDIPKISDLNLFLETKPKSAVLLCDSEDLRRHSILQLLLKVKEIYEDVQYAYFLMDSMTLKGNFLNIFQCFDAEIHLKNQGFKESIQITSDESVRDVKGLVEKFDNFFLLKEKYWFFQESILRKVLSKRGWVMMYWSYFEQKDSNLIESLLKFSNDNNENPKLFLAKIDIQDTQIRKWLRFLGFDIEKPSNIKETLIFLRQDHIEDNILKYIYDKEEISLKNLENYFEEIRQGKKQPHFRNFQKTPVKIAQNLIRMDSVSYRKFIEKNEDNSKDFLIAFCPERDKRCGKFLDFYKEFAEGLFHLNDLMFGVFDPETNDFQGKEVRVFPTIRLFPAKNRKNVEEFRGKEINQASLDEFLKKHLTILQTTKIRGNSKNK